MTIDYGDTLKVKLTDGTDANVKMTWRDGVVDKTVVTLSANAGYPAKTNFLQRDVADAVVAAVQGGGGGVHAALSQQDSGILTELKHAVMTDEKLQRRLAENMTNAAKETRVEEARFKLAETTVAVDGKVEDIQFALKSYSQGRDVPALNLTDGHVDRVDGKWKPKHTVDELMDKLQLNSKTAAGYVNAITELKQKQVDAQRRADRVLAAELAKTPVDLSESLTESTKDKLNEAWEHFKERREAAAKPAEVTAGAGEVAQAEKGKEVKR